MHVPPFGASVIGKPAKTYRKRTEIRKNVIYSLPRDQSNIAEILASNLHFPLSPQNSGLIIDKDQKLWIRQAMQTSLTMGQCHLSGQTFQQP